MAVRSNRTSKSSFTNQTILTPMGNYMSNKYVESLAKSGPSWGSHLEKARITLISFEYVRDAVWDLL